MSNVITRAGTLCVLLGGLGIAACASPSGPSAIPSGKAAVAAELGQSSARAVPSELTVSAVSRAVTDLTLANAGWTCFAPGNGLILCGPPGLGLPPLPPTGDGRPAYDVMAFTLEHQFVHQVKLLRPDIYNGQPCLGGEPWALVGVINYYECIIPGR